MLLKQKKSSTKNPKELSLGSTRNNSELVSITINTEHPNMKEQRQKTNENKVTKRA